MLGAEPPPPEPPPRASLAPSPERSELPVDEAIRAVAELAGTGSVRCRLALDARGATARWPFTAADWDGSVLRAVVPTPEGSRVIRGGSPPTNAAAVLEVDDALPLGILRWSGAGAGRVGGCELLPTARAAVRGRVEATGGSPAGFDVQVCGARVEADGDGRFTAPGWRAEPCLAYVAQAGWTRGAVAFEVGAVDELVLKVERDTERPVPRRVVVRGEGAAVRALQDPGLSDPARAVLRGWAAEGLAERETRQRTSAELDALAAPAP